jgi:putative ABC transport system substrate-binding protein
MKRREFIMLVGGAAAAWPLAARAQQTAIPVIGVLGSESAELFAFRVRAFRQGLSETGYIEGQNVSTEYRWAEGQYDRLPAMAADLVRRQVTVIAAMGGIPGVLAAKAATTTIPIVFSIGADPVTFGLVTSLNRPGSNVTGITNLNLEVAPKRLEMLHEMVPTAGSIAVLVNPTNPTVAESNARDLEAAARILGLQLHLLQASTELDILAAFASLVQMRASALLITNDPFFNSRGEQLAALAGRYAVPAIHAFRSFPAAGGLMSYGGSVAEEYRLTGVYTARILKGEKPADLPVQRVTKVELIINLKTAATLGITVPLALQASADEVIE